MRKAQILSGEEIVAKGEVKQDATLPEIGVKDVIPNGSWLEQKQIQAALDARKNLVEVLRIEKQGVLSQGEWVEDLGLVKVTHHVGGHWQYMGHVRKSQLYIQPEEALYLMEINAFQLKYNEVTVSLQEAYALLLQGKVTLHQYKVYASLSRLGYKILRHDKKDLVEPVDEIVPTEYERKMNLCSYKRVESKSNSEADVTCPKFNNEPKVVENKSSEIEEISANSDCNESVTNKDEIEDYQSVTVSSIDPKFNNEPKVIENKSSGIEEVSANSVCNEAVSNKDNIEDNQSVAVSSNDIEDDINIDQNAGDVLITEDPENSKITNDTNITEPSKPKNDNNITHLSSDELIELEASDKLQTIVSTKVAKVQSMLSRRYKTLSPRKVDKYFENVPEMCQKPVITLNVPEERHLPRNVFLNNTSYVISIENIRQKSVGQQNNASTYSLSDEVNAAHVGRLNSFNRNVTMYNDINNGWTSQFPPQNNFPRFQQQQWFPFGSRPRNINANFLFNYVFQRPFMPTHMNFPPRFNFFPRYQMQFNPRPPRTINWNSESQTRSENATSVNERETVKRSRNKYKTMHLEAIKGLAKKMKHLIRYGVMSHQNIVSLKNLINTYNVRYTAKLRLGDNLNLINDEIVVDTIELDDDEDEPVTKRPRKNSTTYDENLQAIRRFAQRLKDLETKGKANSRHRRAFSNMINNFNKSYRSELYYDNNYEILDRRQIVLDSSDSDCILDETVETNKSDGKKFINPFSILRKLSVDDPSTSKEIPSKYTEISKVFNKNWLPRDDDFGRAEVISKKAGYQCLVNSINEEYIFEFIKNYQSDYKNWLEIKLSFWESVDDSPAEVSHEENTINADLSTNSLVKPEDCKDMAIVLQKLRIIQTCKQVKAETSLIIDFDVWNRDVPQFKKTDKPTAHFRILCIDEKSGLPSGSDIQALYAQYKDNVPIVLAIVGIGSISYLQMKPSDLPVYISTSELGLARVFVG